MSTNAILRTSNSVKHVIEMHFISLTPFGICSVYPNSIHATGRLGKLFFHSSPGSTDLRRSSTELRAAQRWSYAAELGRSFGGAPWSSVELRGALEADAKAAATEQSRSHIPPSHLIGGSLRCGRLLRHSFFAFIEGPR